MKRGVVSRIATFALQKMAGASVHPFLRLLQGGLNLARLSKPMSRSTWVMRAIKWVSQPVSSVPLQFYADRRGGEQLYTDAALDAFWQNPARGLSWEDFIDATVGWLKLSGEAFWLMDDSWLVRGGVKSRLIVAKPKQMNPIVIGGEVVGWRYTDAGGEMHALLPEQVLHIKNWNPDDDWRGLSELDACRDAAEADYLAGRFYNSLMRNSGQRGEYITAQGSLMSDEQVEQVAAMLREKQQAQLRGEFRPMFLPADIKVEDAKLQSPDAAFIAGRVESRHEIFTAFGVPASLADVKASYSIGSASDLFHLVQNTCMPVSRKLEGPIDIVSRKFKGLPDNAPLYSYFEWAEHPVMRESRREVIDSAVKLWEVGMPMKMASQYLGMGLPQFPGWEKSYLPFSVAEAGAVEDPAASTDFAETSPLEESPAKMLRSIFAQRKQQKALPACHSVPASGLQPPASTSRTAAGECPCCSFAELKGGNASRLWREHMARRRKFIAVYESKFSRVLQPVRREVLRKLAEYEAAGKSLVPIRKAGAAATFLFNLADFRREFYAAMRTAGRLTFDDAGKQLCAEVGKDDVWLLPPVEVQSFLSQRENRMSNVPDEVYDDIRAALQQGLDDGLPMDGLANAVRGAFNECDKMRGTRIAMTETAAAYGSGRDVAMKQAGVRYKQWLTSGNDNVRPAHADAQGQTVPVDDSFVVDGEELEFPGDPNGSAGNVINCHCVSIAVSGPEDDDNLGDNDNE